jgi:hypothetical protein
MPATDGEAFLPAALTGGRQGKETERYQIWQRSLAGLTMGESGLQ